MNPHTRYLAVGLFFLIGVVAVVVSIMWLGQQGRTMPTSRYQVQIHSDVNGLSNGSAVRYLGVDVGSVLNITLRRGSAPFVEVLIEIYADVPVDTTTFATLVVQGVTGIANVDLGSDPYQTRIVESDEGGLQIIPFRQSGLSALLAGGGDISNGARQLLLQLNQWTGEENLQRVKAILADIEQVTGVLKEQRGEVPLMIGSLKTTLARMDRTMAHLETAMAEDLPVIAGDIRNTSARLVSISAQIDGWLIENDESIDRLLGEGVDSVSDLVVDLQELANQLSGLSARLREDPSRLVYRARHEPVVADP